MSLQIVAQDNTPTAYPTRTNYRSDAFPPNLYCNDIQTSGVGSEWGEVTIGVSEIEQLVSYVESIGEYRVTQYADFISFYRFGSDAPYPLIESCIEEDTGIVNALKISIDGMATIEDYITIYGIPDAVTWGNNNISRTVFWFEEGVAASVYILEESEILDYGEIGLLVYFPYQPLDNFEERWPFNRTNTENPVYSGRVYDPSPSGEQNPFDFDATLATMTAQPHPTATKTPTPTEQP